jgi:mono/diheme cytochrome c family protein
MSLSRRAVRPPLVAGAIAIGLLLANEAGGQTTPEARGQALVARNCGMCHAIDKAGDSPNPQAPPFRRLHERYPVSNLAEALAEGILVGHTQMPEFRFSAQETIDIIAYLESIQTNTQAQLNRKSPSASGRG